MKILRRWINRIRLSCLRYLLATSKHYHKISSAGPGDGGHYDTYWVRLDKYEMPKEEASEGEDVNPARRMEPIKVDSKNIAFDAEAGCGKGEILAREFVKSENDTPEGHVLTLEMIDEYSVNVRHFYFGFVFEFSGYIRPAIERFFRIYKARALGDRIADWWFRKRLKTITNRLQVLKAIVELNDQGIENVSSLDICRFLYGDRMYSMDSADRQKLYNEKDRLIRSLLALGALSYNGRGYKHNAHGLNQIIEWTAEMREERAESFHRWLVVILTLILAASSYFSAWFQYCEMESKPFPEILSTAFLGCPV